jgi:hypothetical protein
MMGGCKVAAGQGLRLATEAGFAQRPLHQEPAPHTARRNAQAET